MNYGYREEEIVAQIARQAESHEEWVWRHTAQGEISFEKWQAQRAAADRTAQAARKAAQRSKHEAHIATWHKHRNYGHLPEKTVVGLDVALQIIAAKFGTKS